MSQKQTQLWTPVKIKINPESFQPFLQHAKQAN